LISILKNQGILIGHFIISGRRGSGLIAFFDKDFSAVHVLVVELNVEGAFLRVEILIKGNRPALKVSHDGLILFKEAIFLRHFNDKHSSIITCLLIFARVDADQQYTLSLACGILELCFGQYIRLEYVVKGIFRLEEMVGLSGVER
jgi:hypothetical protein